MAFFSVYAMPFQLFCYPPQPVPSTLSLLILVYLFIIKFSDCHVSCMQMTLACLTFISLIKPFNSCLFLHSIVVSAWLCHIHSYKHLLDSNSQQQPCWEASFLASTINIMKRWRKALLILLPPLLPVTFPPVTIAPVPPIPRNKRVSMEWNYLN